MKCWKITQEFSIKKEMGDRTRQDKLFDFGWDSNPRPSIIIPLLYKLSYKVETGQVVGN